MEEVLRESTRGLQARGDEKEEVHQEMGLLEEDKE